MPKKIQIDSKLVNMMFCIETASKSPHPKHKHSAIIIHNGIIIGWATNTHHEHAERRAIAVAALHGYKNNLTLISISIRKDGKFRLAKPCMVCETHIKARGVKQIYYSTNEQTIVKLKDDI